MSTVRTTLSQTLEIQQVIKETSLLTSWAGFHSTENDKHINRNSSLPLQKKKIYFPTAVVMGKNEARSSNGTVSLGETLCRKDSKDVFSKVLLSELRPVEGCKPHEERRASQVQRKGSTQPGWTYLPIPRHKRLKRMSKKKVCRSQHFLPSTKV